MQQTLTARRLLTAIGSIEFPIITIDANGLIEDISSDPTIQSDETLTPTFLDIHTHGCANHDVMEATPQAFVAINAFLATKGVGRYLPTTVTAPIDQTLRALEGIANQIESPSTSKALSSPTPSAASIPRPTSSPPASSSSTASTSPPAATSA
jgi:N-acetylglucosamine-6-phosphate deacetylase